MPHLHTDMQMGSALSDPIRPRPFEVPHTTAAEEMIVVPERERKRKRYPSCLNIRENFETRAGIPNNNSMMKTKKRRTFASYA
jgi:hypothetical protein